MNNNLIIVAKEEKEEFSKEELLKLIDITRAEEECVQCTNNK